MHTWNNDLPIYRQLASLLANRLLEGDPREGEAMPSVRVLASQYVINPLTVNRALQTLVDEGLIESRRGMGMYVLEGAGKRLLQAERTRFLTEEWPVLAKRLRRLGLKASHLDWNA